MIAHPDRLKWHSACGSSKTGNKPRRSFWFITRLIVKEGSRGFYTVPEYVTTPTGRIKEFKTHVASDAHIIVMNRTS